MLLLAAADVVADVGAVCVAEPAAAPVEVPVAEPDAAAAVEEAAGVEVRVTP